MPRLLDSIIDVSGILGPRLRGDDIGYSFAFSPRDAPEVCWKLFALGSQRAQGRPGARCTRGLMRSVHKKCAHEHTGPAESIRPSLRNGFTAYFELSPVNGSFATVAPQEALLPKELDASTAASGPHDFAVRFTPHSSDMASASTATCPNVRDDGRRPSGGTGWRHSSFDLPDGLSGIFFARGLDRLLVICPSCQLVAPDGAISSLLAPRRNPYRRRTLGRECGGRGSARCAEGSQGGLWPVSDRRRGRRAALKRTAKPCGPGARCWCQAGGGFLDPTGFR